MRSYPGRPHGHGRSHEIGGRGPKDGIPTEGKSKAVAGGKKAA